MKSKFFLLFVLTQKVTKKSRLYKILNAHSFRKCSKNNANHTRLRASAVYEFAIFWHFLLSFTKFYKALAAQMKQHNATIILLEKSCSKSFKILVEKNME